MTTALRIWFYAVLCIAGAACLAIGISLMADLLS